MENKIRFTIGLFVSLFLFLAVPSYADETGDGATIGSGGTTGVAEAYDSGWDSDDGAAQKNDIYDYFGLFSTVGKAFVALENPSTITFPRINADNTVTALSAANFLTAISGAPSLLTGWTSGAGTVAATDTVLQGMQKIDGNVALKQTADADLTTWAGITPGANVGTALAVAIGSAGSLATYNWAHAVDTDDDSDIDTIDATLWATKQGLDAALTDHAAGIMTFFDTPIADYTAITPVDGKIYCFDNEAANGDPCNIAGTIDYLAIWDAASYVALLNKDGVWFIKEIQFNGGADALTDDTYTGKALTGQAAGETTAQWDLLYLDYTDNEWKQADNTGVDTSTSPDVFKSAMAMGVAVGSNGTALTVLLEGTVRNDGWDWTPQMPLYLTTSGDMTQTKPIAATSFIQKVGIALSDDEIYFAPEPIDWSVRSSTDADNETLDCIGATNTIWTESAAKYIKLPAVAECPTLSTTVISIGDVAVQLDPADADDTLVDGAAGADGVLWTSKSDTGDSITCAMYDADTVICQSSSLTTPYHWE